MRVDRSVGRGRVVIDAIDLLWLVITVFYANVVLMNSLMMIREVCY